MGEPASRKPVEYVDRATGERTTESVMGDGALRFAYETLAGRTLWPLLFGSKLLSALMGRHYDSPRSRKSIAQLAAIPGCRVEEAEKPIAEYGSFNEFFTRRLKPGSRTFGEGVRSTADGRLRLYLDADADAPFPLKGAVKSLREVFAPAARWGHRALPDGGDSDSAARWGHRALPDGGDSDSAARWGHRALPDGGRFDIAVFRLAPVDYHRFHFPCDCETVGETLVVPGKYHSVNPIALVKYPDVYADNERQIVKCRGAFGDFWLIDVGAFGVGTIVQTFSGGRHRCGDERGYFKFGGSTVIMVTKAGAVKWDEDLVKNSSDGLETRVLCGEHVADVPE